MSSPSFDRQRLSSQRLLGGGGPRVRRVSTSRGAWEAPRQRRGLLPRRFRQRCSLHVGDGGRRRIRCDDRVRGERWDGPDGLCGGGARILFIRGRTAAATSAQHLCPRRVLLVGRDRLEVVVHDLDGERRRDLAAVTAVLDEGTASAMRGRPAGANPTTRRAFRSRSRPSRRAARAPAPCPSCPRSRSLRADLERRALGLVDDAHERVAHEREALLRDGTARGARRRELLDDLAVGAPRRGRRSAGATACRRSRWPRTSSPSAAASRASSLGRDGVERLADLKALGLGVLAFLLAVPLLGRQEASPLRR